MKKTTKKSKKIINEEVSQVPTAQIVPDEVVEKEVKKTYHVYLKINGVEHEKDTNDIAEFIMSVKPEILYTTFDFKVTKGEKSVSRYLYLRDARRLFTNSLLLEAFVRNLLI